MAIEYPNDWGGAREGAGRKSGWKHGSADKLIRVPAGLADETLEAARAIDAGVRLVPVGAEDPQLSKLSREVAYLREEVTNHRRIAVEREADFERCLEQKINLQKELAELRSQKQESVTNSRLADPVAIALIENAIATPKEGGIWNASKAGKAREQIAKALALLKKIG